jgi:hypothetical protein
MYGMLGKPAEAYFVFPSLHYLDYPERKGRVKTSKGLQYTSVGKLLEDFKNGRGLLLLLPSVPREVLGLLLPVIS